MTESAEEVFINFLIGYVSNGHTVSLDALELINKLTSDFVKDVHENNYYNEFILYDYFDYLKEHMPDEFIGFFHLCFNQSRYEKLLIDFLKHYLSN